jgi:hypothetical protein
VRKIKMRNLVYVLSNGETVKTEKEAKASGLNYNISLVEVPKPPIRLTEKQRARRKSIK